MEKFKDRFYLGLISGFLGNIPKTISNEIFYKEGLEKRRFGDIVAGIFLSNLQTRTKGGTIFGMVGDFIIASLLGIPLVYLLSYTGKDKYLVKGVTTGIVGFGTFRGIISKLGSFISYPKDTKTNMMMSWSSFLWGITTAIIVIKLGDERLFKPNPVVLSNPEDEPEI